MPPTTNGPVIPRAKRNAAGEDVSIAVILSNQRREFVNTSSNAIALRYEPHGIWGEGQLASFKKRSGQEKLALRAEDIRRSAISPPFRVEALEKVAAAELSEALDLITELHDPALFYDHISNTIASRPNLNPDRLAAPFVAKTIASEVHNAYLVAASWKVIVNVLVEVRQRGLKDANVRKTVLGNSGIRDAYLLVVDTVDMLCSLAQQKLSISIVGSSEFGHLFSGSRTAKSFSTADATAIRALHRSLIDTIIVELVLPNSRYEPHILVAVLRDALETTPKEGTNKFSQGVFDALGNFAALIEFKDILLGPLHGEEGAKVLKMPRKEAAGEINEFFDAINLSLKASSLSSRWQSWAFPLDKTRSKDKLDELWKHINTVYYDVTDETHTVDSLWRLEDELDCKPSYSTWYIPDCAAYGGEVSSEDEKLIFPGDPKRKQGKNALARSKKRPGGMSRSRAAIMLGDAEEENFNDMPDLMLVVSSDDDEMPLYTDEGTSEESEGDESSEEEELVDEEESEYEGNEIRTMEALVAEAVEEFHIRGNKLPAWTQETEDSQGTDSSAEGSLKSNPILKMLRSYIGRVFETDPTFKPQKLGERPVFGPPRPPPRLQEGLSTSIKPLRDSPEAISSALVGMTVEDAEDEDDLKDEEKKKKKKSKKKKKKKSTAEESQEIKQILEEADTVTPMTPPIPTVTTPNSSTFSPAFTSPKESRTSSDIGASTIPLPIAPTTARSAHSYMVNEKKPAKAKLKTRGEPAPQGGEVPKAKKGFFSKFGGAKVKAEQKEPVSGQKTEGSNLFGKIGVFHLPKRANKLIGRLLGSKDDETKGQSSMRWDDFIKVMTLMGFKVDKGAQGSRVTFYPPDSKDTPIVLHKPHPDPTINPVMLKRISKRLKRHYGWHEDHFDQAKAQAGFTNDNGLD